MQSMTRIYIQSARRSGRTTSLVESVKDGDRICFADRKEAQRVERLCNERGIKVGCIVIDPKTPEQVFERSTPEGRTIFDHSWVEQYFIQAITQAQEEIDHLERQSSAFGAAHRETRHRAEELARWS